LVDDAIAALLILQICHVKFSAIDPRSHPGRELAERIGR
jgi:hypothetical protein